MAVCLACIILRLQFLIPKRRRSWQYTEKYRPLLGAFALLKEQLGMEKADELLETVKTLLEQRHRASSAIEGFNAALRPFLHIHKGVTQNFPELFRACYNLRTRRLGRHKGTSARQVLSDSPVNDWLTLLGSPPADTAGVH